ncbi:phospholipase D-like domain-containing protein [Hymenobacter defluvii]|uniref:Phospholipase D-like domain-containing protein n=1 Tax=Hymenobacter defluvii TaxID=2054411 RepID=A0ABS3TET2_9BACT|nr:phospholipase D-like domain-containing protein [Hymenobacter defluvii]MBO3272170.1 hypothetical protein [Hymenobacter defluvii]
MKILSPHHISGELLELIHSAQKYLVLVSPYVRLGQWQQLATALTTAQRRGVRIEAFVRLDADNASSWEELEALGIRPRLIPNLHAKFYFNETGGVISSLNLLSSSNAQALEIGCKLETEAELRELQDYIKRYLVPLEQTNRPSEDDLYLSKEKFSVVLENYIRQCTQSKARVTYQHNAFEIRALDNRFFLELDKGANRLRVIAIYSQDEQEEYQRNGPHFYPNSCFAYEFTPASGRNYATLTGEYGTRLSTTYLDNLRVPEKKAILEALVQFIQNTGTLKEAVYAPKRAANVARKQAWEAELAVRAAARAAEAQKSVTVAVE